MSEKISWWQTFYFNIKLHKKLKSFHQQGYLQIEKKELLHYLTNYRWQRKKLVKLSDRLADLEKITANDFFDYQQLKIQITEQKMPDLDDFSDLF